MEWGATSDKELVQSWMAFKELHRRGLVRFDIPIMFKPNMSPLDYGWTDTWGAWTDESIMNRVLSTPEDFILAHDGFGAHVTSQGNFRSVDPGVLPRMLAEHLGIADIETLFDSAEVAKEVSRHPLARYKRSRI